MSHTNQIKRSSTPAPKAPFVGCTKLQVHSTTLDVKSMSKVSGEGFWGTVAVGAARGAAAGVGGVAIGVTTSVVWHYYGDDIINYIDETVDYWNTVHWEDHITGESGSYKLFE